MKRKILVLFLILCMAIPVFSQEPNEPIRVEVSFAQEPNPQNAIFFDFEPMFTGLILGGFGIGIGYERAIADNFSLLGHFNFMRAELNLWGGERRTFLDVGGSVAGRFYPLRTAVSGLFLEFGAGFSFGDYSVFENNERNDELSLSGLAVEFGPTFGWKFIGRRTGFFAELGVGLLLQFGQGPIDAFWEEAGLRSSTSIFSPRWLFSLGWTF